MSSNFVRDTKMATTLPPGVVSSDNQIRKVICLDWAAYSSCTFTCLHCHPRDGITRRAKLFKTYYIIAGESSQNAGVYLLNDTQASLLAKLIMQGKLKAGYEVVRSNNDFEISGYAEDNSFTQSVDSSAVRVYFYDNRLTPLPENIPYRLWWGQRFSGIGCIQYHEDVQVTQRDLEARAQNYSRAVIEKFVNEDLNRSQTPNV